MRNLCGNNVTKLPIPMQKMAKKLILRRRKTYRIYKLQRFCSLLVFSCFKVIIKPARCEAQIRVVTFVCTTLSHKLYFFFNQMLGNWNFYIQSQFSVSKNVWIFLIFFHINLGPHFFLTSILELLYLLKWRPIFVITNIKKTFCNVWCFGKN